MTYNLDLLICQLFSLEGEELLTQAEIAKELGVNRRVVSEAVRRLYSAEDRELHSTAARSKGQFHRPVDTEVLYAEIRMLFEREDVISIVDIAKQLGVSPTFARKHIESFYSRAAIANHCGMVRSKLLKERGQCR